MNKKELELKEPELVWEYIKEFSPGYFVEVGANDPFSLSQTWQLEQKGWKGVLVEPLPERAEALRKNRPNSQVFQVACGSMENVGERDFYIGDADQLSSLEKYVDDPNVNYIKSIKVKVMTLDSILEQAKVNRIDFISIDTEGTELEVLKGFSLNKWKPKLLLIEDKIHSLKKHCYLKGQNYKLIRRTGLNNWYIPADAKPPKIDILEKFYIIKRMYLATPLRMFKLYLKRLNAKNQK